MGKKTVGQMDTGVSLQIQKNSQTHYMTHISWYQNLHNSDFKFSLKSVTGLEIGRGHSAFIYCSLRVNYKVLESESTLWETILTL